MKIDSLAVDAMRIVNVPGMDEIHVFWQDVGPGQGYVTITCYGSAWTTYFNAMSGETISQFFGRADVDYLSTKMGITPHLKQRKSDMDYLRKIISTVKRALDQEKKR